MPLKRKHAGATLLATFVAIVAVVSPDAGAAPGPASCENLAALSLPNTRITLAEAVPGSTFTPPGSTQSLTKLPPFCRVVATTSPDVRFEVWLPNGDWNGKFNGIGNGGFAGTISYDDMASSLSRGYATASTDTGHVGSSDTSWALDHPELIEDYGHRGLHVMTENAKEITRAFYGMPPRYSYYTGCSKGGQQGLSEAQRYPGDYDGILVGDPANNWTGLMTVMAGWHALLYQDPDSYIPADRLALINDAVNAKCDAIDGVVDGVIDDPRRCDFEPSVLQCTEGQPSSRSCLSAKQVAALKRVLAGQRSPQSGRLIYPGLLLGGMTGGWERYVMGTAVGNGRGVFRLAIPFWRSFVFRDPNYDIATFDVERDYAKAVATVGAAVDAVNPDLRAFAKRGGKLLMYHGWADNGLSPLNTIDYYESVIAFSGGVTHRSEAVRQTDQYLRLFMVPGMQHCQGGPGPTSFDMLTPLESWVEKGTPPTRIRASHLTNGIVDRTRPLCRYPEVAVYTGNGSTDTESNFVCRDPSSIPRPR